MLDRRADRAAWPTDAGAYWRWTFLPPQSPWRGSVARGFPNVAIVEGSLPDDLPGGPFDLIVFSEIGYYFERGVLTRIRDLLIEHLDEAGCT